MKFSKTAKIALKVAVSLILLALIFKAVGIDKIYGEFVNVNIYYLIISFIFTLIVVFLKALRWKSVIRMFDISLNLKDSVQYTLMSIAFGRVTPGTLGEFIKVKYLKDKTGIDYLKSFVTVIVDKSFDVIAMIFLALLGLSLSNEIADFSLLFNALFAAFILITLSSFIFLDDFLKLLQYILPNKYKEELKRTWFTRKIYLKSIIISIIVWFSLSAQALYVLKAFGVSVSIVVAISLVPLMALSSIAPISLGGTGIREIIAIYFLSIIGIGASKATIFSLFYTFVGAGIPAIIGALLLLFYKKPHLKSKIKTKVFN